MTEEVLGLMAVLVAVCCLAMLAVAIVAIYFGRGMYARGQVERNDVKVSGELGVLTEVERRDDDANA